MKFTHMEIKGFRTLYDVSIPLRPLMVLIGANGSGKSSFLDVLKLARDAASLQLTNALSERGGLDSILTRGKSNEMGLSLKFVPPDYSGPYSGAQCGYEFTLVRQYGLRWTGHEIEHESLSCGPSPFVHSDPSVSFFYDERSQQLVPTDKRDVKELLLPQVQQSSLLALLFADELKKTLFVSSLDISPRAPVRLPQEMRPGFLPMNNGELLFSSLHNIRAEHLESYERIMEVMQQAFPSLARLEFPTVAAGRAALSWYDHGTGRPPFDQTQLSEGTLRFLWLVTILLSPVKPALVLIDEPEISLHPELLMLLAGVLQEASQDSQIIVATHSDRLIRWLQPEHIAVIDKEEDVAKITWADTLENMEAWLQEYSLDQLWDMGELGGRS